MTYYDDSSLRNYAPALKEAIIQRRARCIDFETDNLLGRICINIAMWAMADSVAREIIPVTMTTPDFRSDIVQAVVSGLDKVELGREPKEMLMYLFKVGKTAINDRRKYMSRSKRIHNDVELEKACVTTDFYSNIRRHK